jgi:O-succinylbenzoate synthase
VTPVSTITGAFPSIAVQADANGAYSARQVDRVRALDDYGLRCIEQPFGRHELVLHAEVARTMRTPFCLDESAGSPAEVRAALELGACSVVCVKPARLGGLGAALDVLAECAERRVPVWLGGMFETGYARGVNAALAALADEVGASWPGDLVPATEYLVDDIVPVDRRAKPATRFELAVPRGPGMGLAPVPNALARLRRSSTVHRP